MTRQVAHRAAAAGAAAVAVASEDCWSHHLVLMVLHPLHCHYWQQELQEAAAVPHLCTVYVCMCVCVCACVCVCVVSIYV